jgi:L-threonylcarbamoyladenylate synthase
VTTILTIDPAAPDPQAIARAAEVLRRGGLVAFPTETVYGLGAHALDRAAVRRIFAAKGRPSTDPLIVHVGALAQLSALVTARPDVVDALASRFWPGPLTLVLPRAAAVPDDVTAGLDTVAVRVPAHPVARALLAAVALPIAAPSANLFSRPSPTRAAHVLQDLDGRIDMILDGGPTAVGVESTVLDLSRGVPTLLRPGAVTREMLLDVLPRVDVRDATQAHVAADAMPSPGLLEKHYSPRAPLTLYEGDAAAVAKRLADDARAHSEQGRIVGIVAADEDRLEGDHLLRLGPQRDLATVASRLYAALRDLDAAGVDVILVRAFPTDAGLGLAVQDRLRRAAAGRIVHC